MTGLLTWILCVVTGVATMLGVEYLFRTVDPSQLLPLAQGTGMAIAWLIAYPYAKRQNWTTRGFSWYAVLGVAPVYLIAALRIALKTG